MPRVVACMPTWNGEAFVARTLDSLAAQTYVNLGILISDDASTDRTRSICEAFARAHSNVRLIRQPRNLGWIDNVNVLLKEADAEYVFYAFHDDPLEPTYVERLVDALTRNPRAVLAFADVYLRERVEAYQALDGVTDRWERARHIARRVGWWWIPNRGVFRREAGLQAGGMQHHLAGEFSADWPWLLRLALQGEFVRVPEPLVHKVWLKGGLSLVWRHSLWQKVGVTLACARVVSRAGFSRPQTRALYRQLLFGPLRRRWWTAHSDWKHRSVRGASL